MSWTQAQCEACWIRENFAVDGDAIEVRVPVLLTEKELEICCDCGKPTIIGLYVRKDPKTVPYPKEEK